MEFDIRDDLPTVSVSVITYNHQPYIAECLDSLLMQETDFPYEICLGEDGSTDGTREICIEYAEKHPDRIKLLLRSQSTPGREAYKAQGNYNYLETTKACRGKYVAVCEGDDAWTDPLKLQKQVAIMEADPAVSLVHSDYDSLDVLSGKRSACVHKTSGQSHTVLPDESAFMFSVIQRQYPIATCTVLMRTAAVLEIFEKKHALFTDLPMGDIPMWCELIRYGSFVYMNESLALYRVLAESASNTQSPGKKFKFVNDASNMGLMLSGDYSLPIDLFRANKVKNCNRYALLSGDRKELEELHGNPAFNFSFAESALYHLGRIPGIRELTKRLYQIRYNHNSKAGS